MACGRSLGEKHNPISDGSEGERSQHHAISLSIVEYRSVTLWLLLAAPKKTRPLLKHANRRSACFLARELR
jgi:hypothetical protein